MKLTIFTPTYNRAHTLQRLYDSLRIQKDIRFEWLIIDDGSTDDTESLIRSFQSEDNPFSIRYYKQEHGGKPRAQNWAVDLAEGEYFITCDSNKYLSENAVESIFRMFKSITETPNMCGIGGYRANFSGELVGEAMKLGEAGFADCTIFEQDQYRISGDKAHAFYTEVIRKYKSPEYPGETFVSEGVWLLPMAMDGYKTRWFSEILIHGEYAPDGLTLQSANGYIGHYNNFMGYLHYLRLEIQARGTRPVLFMIHEALDIAREKRISDEKLASLLGCSNEQLRKIKYVRLWHKCYGKLSMFVKKAVGDKTVERLKFIMKNRIRRKN